MEATKFNFYSLRTFQLVDLVLWFFLHKYVKGQGKLFWNKGILIGQASGNPAEASNLGLANFVCDAACFLFLVRGMDGHRFGVSTECFCCCSLSNEQPFAFVGFATKASSFAFSHQPAQLREVVYVRPFASYRINTQLKRMNEWLLIYKHVQTITGSSVSRTETGKVFCRIVWKCVCMRLTQKKGTEFTTVTPSVWWKLVLDCARVSPENSDQASSAVRSHCVFNTIGSLQSGQTVKICKHCCLTCVHKSKTAVSTDPSR